MKQMFKKAVVFLLAAVMTVAFAACGNSGENLQDELNFNIVYAMATDLGFTGDLDDLIAAFKGDNAYQIAVSKGYQGTEGEWLLTLKGAKGNDGVSPHIGTNGNWWIGDTDTNVKAQGQRGENGRSAYELAVEKGYTGSLAQWLDSLNGTDGESGKNAYELAAEKGYSGTLEQWLASLIGAKGENGKTAFELAKQNGFAGTEAQWLTSLIGKDGKSAYEIAKDNGFKGTEGEWIESLKGQQGEAGKSAYEIWLDNGGCGENQCACTETEFLEWMKGQQGEAGLSAYQIFKKHYPDYKGDEKQWITDLSCDRLIRTVTFKAEGQDDVVLSVLYGSTLQEVPLISANDTVWSVTDFTFITAHLVVTAVPATQGLQYALNDSGTAYAVSAGNMSVDTAEVFIPERHEGLPVTEIKASAFKDRTALKKISIPASVASVGDKAFANTAIMNDAADNTAVYAGNWAIGFKQAAEPFAVSIAALRAARQEESGHLTLREGTAGIGDHAFAGKTAITGVTMPNSVLRIGIGSFLNCSALTNVVLSQQLARIEKNAFQNCTALPGVDIPASVVFVCDNAFRNCAKLNRVTFAQNSRVQNIGWNAFDSCVALTEISLPASLKILGEKAFFNCTNLSGITLPADNLKIISANVFENTAWWNAQAGGVVYLDKVLYCYKGTMPAETKVVVREGTLAIAGFAFSGCEALTDITIPASIASIWKSAFDGCTALADIQFAQGSRLETLGETAAKNTAWLNAQEGGAVYLGNVLYTYKGVMPENTVLRVSAGTTAVAGGALQNQTNLVGINLPDSVVYIGDRAFSGCSSLKDVVLPQNVWSMGDAVFMRCSALSSLTISDSVLDIGTLATIGCSNLTIYAESASMPGGWDGMWNASKRPVIWGCKLAVSGNYVLSFMKNAASISNSEAINGIAAPIREGFVFGGWAISEEDARNGVSAYAAAQIQAAPENGRLWAIWTAV